EQAEEEGVRLSFLTIPVEIIGKDGKVSALHCQRARLLQREGSERMFPAPVTGSDYFMEADVVISAIGQMVDSACMIDLSDLRWTRRSTLDVNMANMETSMQGVFAVGDAVTGPATIIEAIGGGKRAANSIDRFLSGIPLSKMPPQVELGYSENEVKEEARRCLRCDICRRCGICIEVCRDMMGIDALQLGYLDFDNPVKTDFRLTAEKCIACGACAENCPNNAMIIEDRKGERILSLCGTILNRQKLVYCEKCGAVIGPAKYLDYIKKRFHSVGQVTADHAVCDVCARKNSAAFSIGPFPGS
ncbi:MAG: FAD-dependent oxidoreductase, partial [Deltaproteobacteria bacterium]|nr:FAD-dependent oxidoreductase [Deltaproteobacteria bacterium]